MTKQNKAFPDQKKALLAAIVMEIQKVAYYFIHGSWF